MFRKENNSSSHRLQNEWMRMPSLDSIKISSEEQKSSIILRLCSILSLLTALIGLFQTLLHVFILFTSMSLKSVTIAFAHLYFAAFGLLIVSIEFEIDFSLRNFNFCESWIGRGLFLIFNGIMLLVLSSSASSRVLYTIEIESTALFVIGSLYLTLGLFCFKQWKQRELNQVFNASTA